MKAEAVRLVIWDLDDTLWRGTLTEGGITAQVPQNYEIVRELARGEIVALLCHRRKYKNALEASQPLGHVHGHWGSSHTSSVFYSPRADWDDIGRLV